MLPELFLLIVSSSFLSSIPSGKAIFVCDGVTYFKSLPRTNRYITPLHPPSPPLLGKIRSARGEHPDAHNRSAVMTTRCSGAWRPLLCPSIWVSVLWVFSLLGGVMGSSWRRTGCIRVVAGGRDGNGDRQKVWGKCIYFTDRSFFSFVATIAAIGRFTFVFFCEMS